MSQEPELVQNRTISGKGVLKVPSDVTRIRYFTLYADVLREPTSPYLNLNYNPPRSRYATLTFLRDGYVQFEHTLDYQRQSWDFVADYTSQNLIALKCAYDGILKSFVNLGVALNAIPVSVTDTIKDYEYLVLLFDEIKIVCYADTGIQLKLYTTANDTCDPDKDNPRKPPPPPPPKPKVPPQTPIPDISPPYDPGNDPDSKYGDNGDTSPNPVDIPDEPPPPPQPCVTVVRGAGLNTANCGALPNLGSYSYNGYAELRPITYQGCSALRLFLDGIDLGDGQTYWSGSFIESRSGDCVPPTGNG
jgi:hypothetical protein